MTSFWSAWIIILTVICLALTTWLLFAYRTKPTDSLNQTMGHDYDGIEEYDNPLPAWWLYLFVGTILFSLVYLAAYPGLGNYQGILNWSSTGQWQEEVAKARETYGPIFTRYAGMPVEEVAKDPQAIKIGQRIFANNCAQCHGSDAKGSRGFPNLTDRDWLYGESVQEIKISISNGRSAVMPPWNEGYGTEQDRENVIQYVLSLSGRGVDSTMAESGKTVFQTFCAACHGSEGKGNRQLGAPNLTDDTWLYGGSVQSISASIELGRKGEMPAHEALLNGDKIHLVTAYVYALSSGLND